MTQRSPLPCLARTWPHRPRADGRAGPGASGRGVAAPVSPAWLAPPATHLSCCPHQHGSSPERLAASHSTGLRQRGAACLACWSSASVLPYRDHRRRLLSVDAVANRSPVGLMARPRMVWPWPASTATSWPVCAFRIRALLPSWLTMRRPSGVKRPAMAGVGEGFRECASAMRGRWNGARNTLDGVRMRAAGQRTRTLRGVRGWPSCPVPRAGCSLAGSHQAQQARAVHPAGPDAAFVEVHIPGAVGAGRGRRPKAG